MHSAHGELWVVGLPWRVGASRRGDWHSNKQGMTTTTSRSSRQQDPKEVSITTTTPSRAAGPRSTHCAPVATAPAASICPRWSSGARSWQAAQVQWFTLEVLCGNQPGPGRFLPGSGRRFRLAAIPAQTPSKRSAAGIHQPTVPKSHSVMRASHRLVQGHSAAAIYVQAPCTPCGPRSPPAPGASAV